MIILSFNCLVYRMNVSEPQKNAHNKCPRWHLKMSCFVWQTVQNPQIFSAFLKRHLTAVAKHENIHVIASPAKAVTSWLWSEDDRGSILYLCAANTVHCCTLYNTHRSVRWDGHWGWVGGPTWQVLQVSPRSQPQSVPQWPVKGGLPLSRM